MIEKIVSPGDKVELKSLFATTLQDDSEGAKTHKTKVYDIQNEDHVEIVMPFEGTKLVLLPIDGEYDVCFFSKGGVYRTTLRVIDRKKDDVGIYILIAELTGNLHKFQRREYYRFNCLVDMKARTLTEEEIENIKKGFHRRVMDAPMQKAVIVDISGGGARFVSETEYEENSNIRMDFALSIVGRDKPFELVANVLYCKKMENKPGYFENRVKFEYINSSTREEIIKYIFDEERRNRKNSKGI
jgi:c-di-GMP-binding flagellar brake protein YcgR